MYILDIDNHLYNIALHSFYADIKDMILQHDIGAKHTFETRVLGYFWILVKISYTYFFNLIIKYILPFESTYLCERTFSDFFNSKNK